MFKTKTGEKNKNGNILNSLIKIHLYKTQNKKLNIKIKTTGLSNKGKQLEAKTAKRQKRNSVNNKQL